MKPKQLSESGDVFDNFPSRSPSSDTKLPEEG